MPPGIGYGNNSLLYSASQYEPYEDPTSRGVSYLGGLGLLGGAALSLIKLSMGMETT